MSDKDTNNMQNKQEENIEGLDLNEILKVRRMKLAELQKNDKDPFKIVKYDVITQLSTY